jgi:hypothetical protein
MADYYSLLAKAVSNLPKAGPEPARKAIYDRARKALVRQLRSLGPALSEADIAREEAALEAAIGKLEGQFSPAAPTSSSSAGSRLTPPVPAPAAPRPSSYVPPPRPAPAAGAPPPGVRIPIPDTPLARPVPPPRPTPAPQPPSERPSLSGGPARPSYAQTSAPSRALPPAPMGLRPSPAAPRYSPPLAARRSEPRYEANDSPLSPAAADQFVDDGYAPSAEGSEVERAEAIGAVDAGLRPSAPRRLERPRRGAAAWILAALVVGVVLAIAVFAFMWRQNPQDLAIKEPIATPTAAATAGPAKIVERVGGVTATPTVAPTPAESPLATETPAAAAPAATPSVAASAAAPVATPTPSPAAAPAPANAGVLVAARAAMLVAVASDPQKPTVSLGSVVWSTIPAAPGQPASVAVKAEADVPELKMHAVMTLRKNTDPSLPASHTIDLRVTFADGADIKGIKDMRVPMMRRDDPPSQDALSGVRVKISDSYFLVGLNRGDAELAHNVDLIANRGWFDFPMLLNDDRIAKLTFEKGVDGERIVNDALAAWK